MPNCCFLIVLLTACLAVNCQETSQGPATTSELPPPTAVDYHFGSVNLDDGPKQVTHTFTITNDWGETVEITDIKRSCGCVGTNLTSRSLHPGESTELRLTLEIAQTGPVQHRCSLIFSNGGIHTINLGAYGRRTTELVVIALNGGHIDGETAKAAVRICLSGGAENEHDQPPVLIGPTGIEATFNSWKIIEKAENRLLRSFGRAIIDLSSYTGSFPVDLRFRDASGKEQSFLLQAPPENIDCGC